MCFGGAKQETKSEIPAWLSAAGQDAYGKASTLYSTPYQAYGGDRVAGPTGDQTTGFQMLRDYIAGGGSSALRGTGVDLITRGAGYTPSTERIVDENGRLGAIADYTNPYTEATLAPTIRNIESQYGKQRMAIGDRATTAGAFGDARQGVLEAANQRDQGQAVGDASYKAFADAFNTAMGLRSGDLARFTAGDEAKAGRDIAAGGALVDTAGKAQSDFMQQLTALLTTGGIQQQTAQSGLDADYEAYLRQQEDPYKKIAALVSTIGGIPYSTSSTTTKDDGGAGALGLLGALVGAI